jgi:hypothetical protein
MDKKEGLHHKAPTTQKNKQYNNHRNVTMKITALRKIYKPNEPTFLDYSWEELSIFIAYPRNHTDKKEIPCWSPASFVGTQLTNENVTDVSCAVFDVDDGLVFGSHYNFRNYQYVAHLTFSHTQEKPKWRLVIPFTKPVPSHLWEGAWLQCKRFFFEHTGMAMDEKCKDARRFYFLNNRTGEAHSHHFNLSGNTLSIDFKRCQEYKEEQQKEEARKLQKMRQRYEALQRLPEYLRNPKESLSLKLSTDSQYREELGNKIGGKSSGGANPRMIGWNCPCCGRNDATYYYINPLGNKTTAQCGHLNSCGQWWTLFQLGRTFGVC